MGRTWAAWLLSVAVVSTAAWSQMRPEHETPEVRTVDTAVPDLDAAPWRLGYGRRCLGSPGPL